MTLNASRFDGVRIVEANSVADYLQRYYKPSRMTDTLLASYEEDFALHGYVCTSAYDNITGGFICWPKLPEWAA